MSPVPMHPRSASSPPPPTVLVVAPNTAKEGWAGVSLGRWSVRSPKGSPLHANHKRMCHDFEACGHFLYALAQAFQRLSLPGSIGARLHCNRHRDVAGSFIHVTAEEKRLTVDGSCACCVVVAVARRPVSCSVGQAASVGGWDTLGTKLICLVAVNVTERASRKKGCLQSVQVDGTIALCR